MSDDSDTPSADGWLAFPSGALRLAAINGFLFGLLVGSGASLVLVFREVSRRSLFNLALVLLGVLLLATLTAWLNRRRWKAAAWKLDEAGLQVRRGRMWRKEILIPRSRVQHLDIERGPIERRFGLATLTVHTAGTRLQALRQPGLRDEDAVALRDALIPASNARTDVV